jgi:hypothetical protein
VSRTVSTVDKRLEEGEPSERNLRIPPIPLNSLLALGLILATVLWRTWAVLQWTYVEDDWRWIVQSYRMPLFHYLTQQYNGHLQPAQFGIVWILTKIAPLNYAVAVIPVLVMSLASGWLMWGFLRALFGDRPGNLIPLAVFLLCPLVVPALVWQAAALGDISVGMFLIATLFAVLRYVRAPSTHGLVLVALAYIGGLLFWEKSLLTFPTAAVFVLLFLGEGEGRARIRNVMLGRWQLWTVLASISVIYGIWYVVAAASQQSYQPTILEVGLLVRTVFLTTVIPTFMGGPWSADTAVFGVIKELTPSVRNLTFAAFAVVVVASLLWRRKAWRGWTLPLFYLGMTVVVVATSNRFMFLGNSIGSAARYFAESVPVLAIGLALAYMVPLDRMRDPAWGLRPFVERRLPRVRAWALRVTREADGPTERSPWWTARKITVVVVIAYAISALITGSKMALKGNERSAKVWLANARQELAAYPRASIYDNLLPKTAVTLGLAGDFAPLKNTLKPIAPKVRWNAASDDMLVFDQGGRLRPAQVVPGVITPPGPVPGCGYRAEADGFFVAELAPQAFGWIWGVGLPYSTDADHDGFVTIDGSRQAVRFHKGFHTLIVVRDGTVGWITVESRRASVCVFGMAVGVVQPLPTG